MPSSTPNSLPLASSLPRVSFRKVPASEVLAYRNDGTHLSGAVAPNESASTSIATPSAMAHVSVMDAHYIAYGYNDGTSFEKPEHYLRHVEPLEMERNRQVEYDMDEQDKEWLDALNQDRRKDQLDQISYESFEIIIDRFEKEWFDLIKRVPSHRRDGREGAADGKDEGSDGEDTECAICSDAECENSNAIVFCDGCNLAVHQDCYGIPYIPEGQWLCRKCTVSPDRAVSCVLCPNEGGAFKQTTQGKWAHLLCAVWIPETGVSNPVYMEPIDSVERIPKARWKLQCYLCQHRTGACIQCDNKHCFTAFHVTCARKAQLLVRSQRQRATHHSHNGAAGAGSDSEEEESNEVLKAYCHKHLPGKIRLAKASEARIKEIAASEPEGLTSAARAQGLSSALEAPDQTKKRSIKLVVRSGADGSRPAGGAGASTLSKEARAYKKTYRSGPPLVPAYIVTRVMEYISKISLRKKLELVQRIARFWSLKREARRGAPLLKRLHLEPWTASKDGKEQTDAQRVKKLEFLFRLREDLEKIRMLAELVRKREKEKLRGVQLLRDSLVNGVLLPYLGVLRKILERVSSLDRAGFFSRPVSAIDVPDYHTVIKSPMDWSTISQKLEALHYATALEFKQDILLVLNNAMHYNKPETAFHRSALRILKACQDEKGGIFLELDRLAKVHSDVEAGVPEGEGLDLEPEESLIDLLGSYNDEDIFDAIEQHGDNGQAPANVVEDLTRHYYRVEATSLPAQRSVKANKRLARIERGKRAAETRRNAREQLAMTTGADASVSHEKRDANRDQQLQLQEEKEAHIKARRHAAAVIASRAAVVARQKKKAEADAAAAAAASKRASASASASVGTDLKRSHSASISSKTLVGSDGQAPPSFGKVVQDRHTPETHEVQEMDDWDSFKLFNSGWVLPDGARRVRHPPPAVTEPLAKRARTGTLSTEPVPSLAGDDAAERSGASAKATQKRRSRSRTEEKVSKRGSKTRLRNMDTSVSSTGTVRTHFRGSHGQFIKATEDPNKPRKAKTRDATDASSSRSASRSNKVVKTYSSGNRWSEMPPSSPLSSEVEEDDETVRMETDSDVLTGQDEQEADSDELSDLDDEVQEEEEKDLEAQREAEREHRNAIRREKHRLKRLAEMKAHEEHKERMKRSRMEKKAEGAAAMLIDDDAPDALQAQQQQHHQQQAHAASSSVAPKARPAHLPEMGMPSDFDGGTLVWAKMTGWPFYPAEVLDPAMDEVPDHILDMQTEAGPTSVSADGIVDSIMHLVRFFDPMRTFAWVPTTSLRFLFEDDKLDQKLLKSSSMRTNHQRASVRNAYARAKELLDV